MDVKNEIENMKKELKLQAFKSLVSFIILDSALAQDEMLISDRAALWLEVEHGVTEKRKMWAVKHLNDELWNYSQRVTDSFDKEIALHVIKAQREHRTAYQTGMLMHLYFHLENQLNVTEDKNRDAASDHFIISGSGE